MYDGITRLLSPADLNAANTAYTAGLDTLIYGFVRFDTLRFAAAAHLFKQYTRLFTMYRCLNILYQRLPRRIDSVEIKMKVNSQRSNIYVVCRWGCMRWINHKASAVTKLEEDLWNRALNSLRT
jgi:hypothetical protein